MKPLTTTARSAIKAIVAVHETGKLPSPAAYSTVAVLKDGAGISYGAHQATDRSGSLDAVVLRYLDLGGRHASALRPHLGDLADSLSSKADPGALPPRVVELMAALAKAGSDPVMHLAQEQVFDELYWQPAHAQGVAMDLLEPLSYLALYDTAIHSGPARIPALRRLFPERPPATGGLERAWTVAFLQARRAWLLASSSELTRSTVYRVDGMLRLAQEGRWSLESPFPYLFGITVPKHA